MTEEVLHETEEEFLCLPSKKNRKDEEAGERKPGRWQKATYFPGNSSPVTTELPTNNSIQTCVILAIIYFLNIESV